MSATIGTKLFTFISGQYVGKDEFGNKYYQARKTPKTGRRKRWVMYKGMPEPSKVPPHWHGWLHYTVDTPPVEGVPVSKHAWQKPHLPNATGTDARYLPQGHVLKGAKRAANSADIVAWKPE